MSYAWHPDGSVPVPVQGSNIRIAVASVVFTIGTGIVVTTQTPHGCQDQDTIELEGVYNSGSTTVLSAINGVYSIGYLTTTTFILNTNATLAATQPTTGYITDYSINPVFQLMSDGDAVKGSNINPAIQGATNAIPFLYRKAGLYRFHASYFGTVGTARTIWSTTTTTSTSPVPAANATDLLSASFASYPSPPIVNVGDLLEVEFSSLGACVTSGTASYMTLSAAFNGGAYVDLTSFVGEQIIDAGSGSSATLQPFTLKGSFPALQSGVFNLGIMVSGKTSASTVFEMRNLSPIVCNHYRANK